MGNYTNPWLPGRETQKQWCKKWSDEENKCNNICSCKKKCSVLDRMNKNICLLNGNKNN